MTIVHFLGNGGGLKNLYLYSCVLWEASLNPFSKSKELSWSKGKFHTKKSGRFRVPRHEFVSCVLASGASSNEGPSLVCEFADKSRCCGRIRYEHPTKLVDKQSSKESP